MVVKNYIIFMLGLREKDVQATEEASSPQKRTSSTSCNEISLFSIFMGHLYSPESGCAFPMRIRIRPTIINAKPCRSGYSIHNMNKTMEASIPLLGLFSNSEHFPNFHNLFSQKIWVTRVCNRRRKVMCTLYNRYTV